MYSIDKLKHGFRVFLSIICLGTIACKKLVEVPPPALTIASSAVFESDVTAVSVLNGLYSTLSSSTFNNNSGLTALSLYGGLSADELSLWSGVNNTTQVAYYTNKLVSNNQLNVGSEYWNAIYINLFTCNTVIEGVNNSSKITPNVKKQLLGEAKFMRAFFYFYLVNLYGDVPLILSTDYKLNSGLPRTSKNLVYQQIIADLKEAAVLLNEAYIKNDGSTPYPIVSAERVRPNRFTANALLARVYLYIGDFANAETQASSVIANSSYYNLTSLNSVFAKNSSEAIWQLQPVTTGTITNTQDGYYFNIPAGGPNNLAQYGNPVYLSGSLLNSFESADQRKVIGNWISSVKVGSTTYYFPYKYKINTASSVSEYIMVFRLAEQYLIRAEARAQLGNISGSQSDLNAIRTRAGLANTTAADKVALLSAILHERQVELFTEFGHRWLDLKRSGAVDAVMATEALLKGSTWDTNQQYYPIPFADLQKAPNLVQNPGY